MFTFLGKFVARRWLLVILLWTGAVIGLRLVAPRWDDVTHDGDFAYLPARMPSVAGERLMAEAFPQYRAKSQLVIVVAREESSEQPLDRFVAYDVARRMHNIHGAASFFRAMRLSREAAALFHGGDAAGSEKLTEESRVELQQALAALNEAALLDDRLAAVGVSDGDAAVPNREASLRPQRLAAIYHNRALVLDFEGKHEEAAADRLRAKEFDPSISRLGPASAPPWAAEMPVLDVWTWRKDIFGEALLDQRQAGDAPDVRARLIIVHLANEFMALDNLRVLSHVEDEVDVVRDWADRRVEPRLEFGISGSAAVGSDLLRASGESIKNTELIAILLVAVILVLVYRSPLLVGVPLVSIGASYLVSINVVSLLTQVGQLPGFGWWDFMVFKTTKIFIVVILCGAGTDFCLFLIARYREELSKGLNPRDAIAESLSAVGDALAGSALTTVVGLAMMFFAEFGKFSYSGPTIGVCLLITLIACVTLTPALLRAFGTLLFWPWGVRRRKSSLADDRRTTAESDETSDEEGRKHAMWDWLARMIVAHPGLILIVSFVVLAPWAWYGVVSADHVTYDILSELDPQRPSRQATELLKRHYDVGESGPVIILAQKKGTSFLPDNDDEAQASRNAIWQLTVKLHELPGGGVKSVRSFATPVGGEPGGSSFSPRRILQQSHSVTKAHFITQVPQLNHNVTRFEVVLENDVFSLEATQTLSRIDEMLQRETADNASFWHDATFAYAGTTAAIRDLRSVTRSDTIRIEVLVVLAVLLVLLAILRRPVVCLYMIVSVLFSYYVTLGMTELFFQWAYGATFHGLDWKVPIFLFVILVAIGEDYNIYLATRVFEEQQRLGPLPGLRRAIVCTGGIITSCGLIMAGTFVSMTSGTWAYVLPSWLPLSGTLLATDAGPLRGIVELGFALALGVLLDTFVVRPILLPAFLALIHRRQTDEAKEQAQSAVEVSAGAEQR